MTLIVKPKIFVSRKLPEKGMRTLSDSFALDVWEGEDAPPKARLPAAGAGNPESWKSRQRMRRRRLLPPTQTKAPRRKRRATTR